MAASCVKPWSSLCEITMYRMLVDKHVHMSIGTTHSLSVPHLNPPITSMTSAPRRPAIPSPLPRTCRGHQPSNDPSRIDRHPPRMQQRALQSCSHRNDTSEMFLVVRSHATRDTRSAARMRPTFLAVRTRPTFVRSRGAPVLTSRQSDAPQPIPSRLTQQRRLVA